MQPWRSDSARAYGQAFAARPRSDRPWHRVASVARDAGGVGGMLGALRPIPVRGMPRCAAGLHRRCAPGRPSCPFRSHGTFLAVPAASGLPLQRGAHVDIEEQGHAVVRRRAALAAVAGAHRQAGAGLVVLAESRHLSAGRAGLRGHRADPRAPAAELGAQPVGLSARAGRGPQPGFRLAGQCPARRAPAAGLGLFRAVRGLAERRGAGLQLGRALRGQRPRPARAGRRPA